MGHRTSVLRTFLLCSVSQRLGLLDSVSLHTPPCPPPEASMVPAGTGGGGAREQPFGKHSLADMPSCVGGRHRKRREWGLWSSHTHKTPAVCRNLSYRAQSTSFSLLFYFILFYFLAALCGMWDLSSPTRVRTRAPCIESTQS